MNDKRRVTALSEFLVDDTRLFRNSVLIAQLDTPIRELARVDDQLFVITQRPSASHYRRSETNLFSLDLTGAIRWKAPNTGPDQGRSRLDYFDLRIFDREHPKLYVRIDDRAWHYFDAGTGDRLFLDPEYDWSNYPTAWNQLMENQDQLNKSVFAPTLTFYPKLG